LRRYEEPDTKGAALIVLIVLIGLLALAVFNAWSYLNPKETGMDEGQAKAIMIMELTGKEFPPEVARHAVVSFSGTSVAIETHSINLWDGKTWKSK